MNNKKEKIISLHTRLKKKHFAEQFNDLEFSNEKKSAEIRIDNYADIDLTKIWQEEVSELLKRDFQDLSAVTSALAEVIAEKMSVGDQEKPELIEFLKLYFETDRELLSSLEKIFFAEQNNPDLI